MVRKIIILFFFFIYSCSSYVVENESSSEKIDSIINIFTDEYISHFSEYGNSSDVPIFILGSPRSGTTLIEQIVSSHTNILGAGELNYIRKIANQSGIQSNYLLIIK